MIFTSQQIGLWNFLRTQEQCTTPVRATVAVHQVSRRSPSIIDVVRNSTAHTPKNSHHRRSQEVGTNSEFVAHYQKRTKVNTVHYICETYPKARWYRQKMQARTVGTYLISPENGGEVKSWGCMQMSCTPRQWLLDHSRHWRDYHCCPILVFCAVPVLSKCFTNLSISYLLGP